jgi:hypothetical protein
VFGAEFDDLFACTRRVERVRPRKSKILEDRLLHRVVALIESLIEFA